MTSNCVVDNEKLFLIHAFSAVFRTLPIFLPSLKPLLIKNLPS